MPPSAHNDVSPTVLEMATGELEDIRRTIDTNLAAAAAAANHQGRQGGKIFRQQPSRIRSSYATYGGSKSRINNISTSNSSLSHSSSCNNLYQHTPLSLFPPACHALLMSIEGNHRCVDCGAHDPQWASVSYGALLCLQCSGKHRSLGVQTSTVRSISMDSWSLHDIIAMLEGGNGQLQQFFTRHKLCASTIKNATTKNNNTTTSERTNSTTQQNASSSCSSCDTAAVVNSNNVMLMRYKTKAGLFYRKQLEQHVKHVIHAGPYRGREHSRRLAHARPKTLTRANSSPCE